MLAFHRFDPTPCRFPAPRVPVLPPLHVRSLMPGTNALKAGAHWFRRGRYALAQAYRLAGIGGAGALLAPAYHCRTMLDPALALGADVLLYPVSKSLAPEVAALPELIGRSRVPVKALLVPHYFGFPQELGELVALCGRHAIQLIEDCSHMLAGAEQSGIDLPSCGTAGHHAVASPYKFFPTPDGGLLWSNVVAPSAPRLRWPGVAREARAILDLAGRWSRRPTAAALECIEEDMDIALARPCGGESPHEWIGNEQQPSDLYDGRERDVGGLCVSRWIARHTDLGRLTGRRRENYCQWLQAVEGLPGCHPVYPGLPDRCVPYMFPLYVERPTTDFFALKRMGVPIWRWDEMAVSDCDTAASYRLHVLHLPCHQELSSHEMAWMTTAVAAVCGRSAAAEKANA